MADALGATELPLLEQAVTAKSAARAMPPKRDREPMVNVCPPMGARTDVREAGQMIATLLNVSPPGERLLSGRLTLH
ncbi:MAG: hypothetical protein ACXWMU_07170 [Candidatus Limnocylindrales bacterium]